VGPAFFHNRLPYRCKQVTDAGLAHLKGLTALQSLDLRWFDQVTDVGLAHLKSLTALQSLILVGCKRVTDAGLSDLRRALPRCDIGSLERMQSEVLSDAIAYANRQSGLAQPDLSVR
jgi:uncharacterized protein YciI